MGAEIQGIGWLVQKIARRSYKSFFLFTWLCAILKACKSTNKIAVYTSITTFWRKSLTFNQSFYSLFGSICFCKNDLLKRFPLLLAWMASHKYLGFVIGWDHRMCSPPALSPIGTGPSPFRNIYLWHRGDLFETGGFMMWKFYKMSITFMKKIECLKVRMQLKSMVIIRSNDCFIIKIPIR